MAFHIIEHPRAHNKPLKCKMGLHGDNWETMLVGGVPHLCCKKCGDIVAKQIHHGNVQDRDYRKLTGLGKYVPKTKKQMIEDAWASYYRKKYPNR